MEYKTQRVTLRIPKDLHQFLSKSAEKESKSLNAEIIARLRSTQNNTSTNIGIDEKEAEAMHRRVLKKVLTEELGLIKELSDDIKKQNR